MCRSCAQISGRKPGSGKSMSPDTQIDWQSRHQSSPAAENHRNRRQNHHKAADMGTPSFHIPSFLFSPEKTCESSLCSPPPVPQWKWSRRETSSSRCSPCGSRGNLASSRGFVHPPDKSKRSAPCRDVQGGKR